MLRALRQQCADPCTEPLRHPVEQLITAEYIPVHEIRRVCSGFPAGRGLLLWTPLPSAADIREHRLLLLLLVFDQAVPLRFCLAVGLLPQPRLLLRLQPFQFGFLRCKFVI